MSDQATLQGIAVRGASRAPMREVQEASVTVTDGIVEDYRGTGLRQVTFIDAGQWRQVVGELGVELPWHTRRANLLVDGLDLPAYGRQPLAHRRLPVRDSWRDGPLRSHGRIAGGLAPGADPGDARRRMGQGHRERPVAGWPVRRSRGIERGEVLHG